MVGPPPDRASTTAALRRLGFRPFETIRLLELKRRYQEGAFSDTLPAQRLTFARWLVQSGRLSEWQNQSPARRVPRNRVGRPSPVRFRRVDEPGDRPVGTRRSAAANRTSDSAESPVPAVQREQARQSVPTVGRRDVTSARIAMVLLIAMMLGLSLLVAVSLEILMAALGS
jgi:hypothetical protein